MALRDKLMERAQEHLGPGERVQHVFMAQTGPSPYWIFLTWLTAFWNKYQIGVVTDTQIVTLRATAFRPSFVKQPPTIERFDRAIFGPCSGLWGKVNIAGTKYHVHKRFHKDLAEADAETARMGIVRGTAELTGSAAAGSSAATASTTPVPTAPPETPPAAVAQPVAHAQPAPEPAAATPPAGWYPDPSGTGGQRYWDGNAWTNHTA